MYMNKYQKIFIVFALFLTLFTGCTQTKPDSQEIKELPENAEKIVSLALNSISGTFTHGELTLADKGYIIFDIQLDSGSIKTLGIKDVSIDALVCSVEKPQTALYNSAIYEYNADSEYKLSFTDAKDAIGTLTIYFVKDSTAENENPPE